MPVNAADVMTTKVITVTPDSTISEAAKLMLQYRISGLPVLDDRGQLVGVVTEGDLLRRNETNTTRKHSRWLEFMLGPGKLSAEYVHAYGRKVGEVMTSDPITISHTTPLVEVVDTLQHHHVKRVPVVRDGKLIGIVSRANLVQALASLLPHTRAPSAKDAEIRQRILDEIDRRPWSPGNSVNVTVHDGIVELWGTIFDDRERLALKVAAENVAGVRAVRDHVLFVEPYTGFAVRGEAG
jgi:CBS domain-containing protein